MPTKKNNPIITFIANILLPLLVKRRKKITTADLKKADYTASTQKIGISLTEKIRNTFRRKWIKKF